MKQHLIKVQQDKLLGSDRQGANSLQTEGDPHSRGGGLSRKYSIFEGNFIYFPLSLKLFAVFSIIDLPLLLYTWTVVT